MTLTPKLMTPTVQLTASVVTEYTAPAGGAIIKEIILTNATAAAVTARVHLIVSAGSASAANRIISDVSVPANGVLIYSLSTVMAAASFIQALAGSATSVNLTISGMEIT